MTNVEKLQEAKLIPLVHRLSEEEVEKLNRLSQNEIECLITLKRDLGDAFIKRHIACPNPDCIV
jgi:hypothetical protein